MLLFHIVKSNWRTQIFVKVSVAWFTRGLTDVLFVFKLRNSCTNGPMVPD